MLEDRVEAELRARLTEHKKTMDAAQVQAALDAATKKAEAAEKAASDARKETADVKSALDLNTKALNDLVTNLKASQDAEKARKEAGVKAKAEKAVLLRAGGDATKVKPEEVARLVKLGEDALDDQIHLLSTPGIVAPSMKPVAVLHNGQDSGLVRNRDGSYTIADWSKFPKPSRDKNDMGTPTIRGVA